MYRTCCATGDVAAGRCCCGGLQRTIREVDAAGASCEIGQHDVAVVLACTIHSEGIAGGSQAAAGAYAHLATERVLGAAGVDIATYAGASCNDQCPCAAVDAGISTGNVHATGVVYSARGNDAVGQQQSLHSNVACAVNG